MPPAKLTKADKDIVNRAVPEGSNKVVHGAVARLYVNHPDRTRWNFTGISGVVVLAQDLVGKTLFFKIVDIKVGVQNELPDEVETDRRIG
jgi:Wiskott-Aldrich syndrome protein